MTSRTEREVLALILGTNAELVSAILRGAAGPADPDVLAAIAATRGLLRIVDDILHTLVRQARADGHTWAEIGDILHVTRQAAFQRFDGPPAPATDRDPAAAPLAEAERRAVTLFESYARGQWEELRADFDERLARTLTAEVLVSVRRRLTLRVGAVRALGEPTLAVRDGYTVVDVPLRCAEGDLTGRVTFAATGQVAGFFLLDPRITPDHARSTREETAP